MSRLRVVLDTNSLLVSISKKSVYRPIFDAIIKQEINLLITNEIITEYTEVIERKTNSQIAQNIIEFLLQSPYTERVVVYYKWLLLKADEDDDKFADCAISGNADFIVTDDKHFRILSEEDFPPVKVIGTREFLQMIIG